MIGAAAFNGLGSVEFLKEAFGEEMLESEEARLRLGEMSGDVGAGGVSTEISSVDGEG